MILNSNRNAIEIHIRRGLPFPDTSDHEEKPSQRVPSPYILLLLVFYLLAAWFAQSMEDRMPTIIKELEIPASESNVFSEENAKKYLGQILGDQPRVAGTQYHLTKTKDLMSLLQDIGARANIPIRTDWQYASGDYWLQFSSPHVNLYRNLSNVIAVLEGESGFRADGNIGSSILINCHYDSVPFAIGASDNGVFCAVMVEILSKLSRREKKLRHNIVFLFNGAEETALQASHGFLSHPWARGVRSVVNLDSAGMNGIPNLFQVTAPAVLASYQRTCPRPVAQSVGEVLFRSGIIPSDTDFRIFRDFGHMYGIDIAFVKWGVVYHTRNDEPSLLLDGVMQNAGNTILALMRDLANLEELPERGSPGTAVDAAKPPPPYVYYDYLTLFMVSYSLNTALVVDLLAVLLGAASVFYYLWIVGIRWSSVEELLLAVLSRVMCALAGVLAVSVSTLLMYIISSQLRYLSRQWLVIPLYWLPYVVAAFAASHLHDSWRTRKSGLTRLLRSAQAMAGTRLALAATLLALLPFPALGPLRYLLAVPLTLMSVAAVLSLTLLRCLRPTAWQQLVIDALLSLPAVLLPLSLGLRMSALLLPVAGRSGSTCPDCSMAVVSSVLAFYALVIPSGVELVFSRRRLWQVLGAISAVCVLIMLIPFSPYQLDGVATQRHYWFHSQITSYDLAMRPVNRTSGVLVTKVDANSISSALDAITSANGSLDVRRVTAADCEQTVYCDLPLYRPRFETYLMNSLFVRLDPPNPFQHELRLTGKVCDQQVCNMTFVMIGPAYNALTIWPRAGVNLTAWSFASPTLPTLVRRQRPVFVVVLIIGTYSEPLPRLEFNLTFSVPSPPPSPLVEISHHAHQVHHPENFTPQYRRLLDSMPNYFNVASFLSFQDNYMF